MSEAKIAYLQEKIKDARKDATEGLILIVFGSIYFALIYIGATSYSIAITFTQIILSAGATAIFILGWYLLISGTSKASNLEEQLKT